MSELESKIIDKITRKYNKDNMERKGEFINNSMILRSIIMDALKEYKKEILLDIRPFLTSGNSVAVTDVRPVLKHIEKELKKISKDG